MPDPTDDAAARTAVLGWALPGAAATKLTPIDYGDVCVNVDTAWFAKKGLPAPATLEQLADPTYKDLLVVENGDEGELVTIHGRQDAQDYVDAILKETPDTKYEYWLTAIEAAS